MIKGVIIVNNHGKPRLVKFYQAVESEQLQQTVIRRVYQQVTSRPDSFCNYLEGAVPEWGENVVAFVVARDGSGLDAAALDRYCIETLEVSDPERRIMVYFDSATCSSPPTRRDHFCHLC